MTDHEINTLADQVASRMARLHSPVLTLREVMLLTGKESESAFYRWASMHGVKPCSKGRYSRRAIERSLNQEARKGEK